MEAAKRINLFRLPDSGKLWRTLLPRVPAGWLRGSG